MLQRWTLCGVLLFLIVSLSACAHRSKARAPLPVPVATLAVLPLDSMSNHLEAPEILRNLVAKGLHRRGYQTLEQAKVDEVLKAEGISEGGQLPSISSQKLGEKLGVEALLYGEVTEFKFVNVGFYQDRQVGLRLRLVEAVSGQTLWENEKTVSHKKVFKKEDAGRAFAAGLGQQALEKILKSPLWDESVEVVNRVLSTLPKCR